MTHHINPPALTALTLLIAASMPSGRTWSFVSLQICWIRQHEAINESDVANAALELLGEFGFTIAHGSSIDPDSASEERTCYDEALLTGRLRRAFPRLNPHLSEDIWEEVLRQLLQTDAPSLVNENRRLHRYSSSISAKDAKGGGDTEVD